MASRAEQRAAEERVLRAAQEALDTLNCCVWECPRCSYTESTADMDAAIPLREALGVLRRLRRRAKKEAGR